MLEAIRERAQGWLAKLILALITIPFALWGVDSYFSSGGKAEIIAEVGDATIPRQAFTDALKEQAERMRQALGQNFDPAAVDTDQFRKSVLDHLVEEEAVFQEAGKAGLQVSDTQIAHVLQQLPDFQENGKFSQAAFEREVARRGYTPASFIQRLKREMSIQLLQQPLVMTAMVSATSSDMVARIASQRREVSWADITPAALTSQATSTPQEVQAYYSAHKTDFTDPEAVRIEYVTLSLDDLARSVVLTEKQVQDYFSANASNFGPPEERTASHILITAPEGDATARKLARAKAESVLAAVKQSPQSFAEVAKRDSQDPGSAEAGGSLGSFDRGKMVKPFEDAVFAMKPGELRLVETQFGFHVIRLDGIKAGGAVLASVRPQVEEELRRKQAQLQFADVAEQFSNLVYEQPASLQPAATALKLAVQTSDWLTKKSAGNEPYHSPKLLEAVFTADAIKGRQNVEPVEIARNMLVAARVAEHRPPREKSLTEVSGVIQQKLSVEKTANLSEKQGLAQIALLRQGKEPQGTAWSAFKTVGRQDPAGLDGKSLAAIMRVEVSKLPAYAGLKLPDGGYRIIRVTRVIDDSVVPPMLRSAVESGIRQTHARADELALTELAKVTYKVEIRQDALKRRE